MSLEVRDINVRYGRTPAIAGVSAKFPRCQLTALIGPNGAGKSTLLRAIAGLLPAEGAIALDGHKISRSERGETIAYMPQDTSANSSLTLLEVVLLGRLRSLGMSIPTSFIKEAEDTLSRFGLSALGGRTLDAVSGGQRQLVFLAQALFQTPRVLLLDEPTAALDLRHQLLVLETVRDAALQDQVTVVVAMHDLSLAAQFADTILCLANGRLDVEGSAEAVLTPDRLRRLYGVEADVMRGPNGSIQITPLRAL